MPPCSARFGGGVRSKFGERHRTARDHRLLWVIVEDDHPDGMTRTGRANLRMLGPGRVSRSRKYQLMLRSRRGAFGRYKKQISSVIGHHRIGSLPSPVMGSSWSGARFL